MKYQSTNSLVNYPIKMNSKLTITIATLILIIAGTYFAVQWAKGYRFNLTKQSLQGSGLLVANSSPQGASVIINDELKTATDDTLHLYPDTYNIKLEKEGFFTWEKNILIEKELVTQTNAQLFPSVPNLSALTVNTAQNPTPSPNGHKIAYTIATGSANLKYGIWVLQLNDSPLRFGSNSIQIIQDTPQIKFTQAQLFWAPNSSQILAYFDDTQAYLLDATSKNESTQMLNVAFQLESIIQDWQQQLALEQQEKMIKLPEFMQKLATSSATLTYFSPSEEKIFYTATQSATIPNILVPPLPASNSQPETRDLSPGDTYVYDIKEDKNFLIKSQSFTQEEVDMLASRFSLPSITGENTNTTPIPDLSTKQHTKIKSQIKASILNQLQTIQMHYSPIYTDLNIQWFPTSQHLVEIHTDKIIIKEYDNTNQVPIYSGPFSNAFVYPWPNGDKMVILTSLTYDNSMPTNLYSISLQ